MDLPDVTLSTEASIGVALAQVGHTDADVLRHADTAMYAAKSAGSTIATYTAALDAGRADRLALLADLHLALERDEIEVHYQPKLDLALDRITSVEALIRWTHPTLGPLTPGDFMPLAESTGLIDLVTRTVLRQGPAPVRRLARGRPRPHRRGQPLRPQRPQRLPARRGHRGARGRPESPRTS